MHVGSFLLVFKDHTGLDDSILLVRHGYGEKKWSLPGGRLEVGERDNDAAVREAEEECRNLKFQWLRQLGIFCGRKAPHIAFVHEGFVTEGEIKAIVTEEGQEITDIDFFSPETIEQMKNSEAIYPAQYRIISLIRKRWVECIMAPIHDWLSEPTEAK